MEEYKFQLVIFPESYEYCEEEIVYRIFFNNQLISERSLPILNSNQALIDTFFIDSKKLTIPNNLVNNYQPFTKEYNDYVQSQKQIIQFINLKKLKAKIKKIIINQNEHFDFLKDIKINEHTISTRFS